MSTSGASATSENISLIKLWFVPLSVHYRQHKLYNKELYADFIAAQIKTLSFLAYIIRIYQVLLLIWVWSPFKMYWNGLQNIMHRFLFVWLLNRCVCVCICIYIYMFVFACLHLVRIWLESILSRWWKGCCSCCLTVLRRLRTCARSCWSLLSTSSPLTCAAVCSALRALCYTLPHYLHNFSTAFFFYGTWIRYAESRWLCLDVTWNIFNTMCVFWNVQSFRDTDDLRELISV